MSLNCYKGYVHTVVTTALTALVVGCVGPENTKPITAAATAATYVGRQACMDCHRTQHESWAGSHHDLAMQVADETTVRGNFDNAIFTHFGVESSFFRRDAKFVVSTDGPDGELAKYEITHTFGAYPLQQYLVAFPEGRYQVLGLAWDTRPAEEGGQRWFHVYPGEAVPHDDVLHWTGPAQNWNHMCAECHSTDLHKGYVSASDRFDTTFSEIDVSCEACHGPAGSHVAWAESAENGEKAASANLGLLVRFNERRHTRWVMDPKTGTAERSEPPRSHDEIETCARCHSRRSVFSEDYVHGRPILDTHRVAILDEALYHPDGQILEEVYVYGSFLQSKMYRQGVTCSDCHDAHSGRLQAEGNALCSRCHLPARFDTPTHHFHKVGTDGALCVECHMPAKTYMVVDPRRDHSLRIPRPDLSMKLGTPNACNACHTDESSRWASAAIERWYGEGRRQEPHWGEAIHAGRHALAGAQEQLVALVADDQAPAIARATAVSLLPRFATAQNVPIFESALHDPDPLVRIAALGAIEVIEPHERLKMSYSLLDDDIRTVRLQVARTLAAVPEGLLSFEQRSKLDEALGDYRRSRLIDADRAEAHLDLGTIHLMRGELAKAEGEYNSAMAISPRFVPTYVNLADLYRAQGRDEEGERLLRQALEFAPDDGDLHHALGLALIRIKRLDAAIQELTRAADLSPDRPRYAYVLAVALHSTGGIDAAVETLRAAYARHPADPDIAAFLSQLTAQH